MLHGGRVSSPRHETPPPAESPESVKRVSAKLNLASQPFRNRALPWTAAAAVSLASLLALVLILVEYRRARAEADLAERQAAALRRERDELQQQAEAIRESIPEAERRTLEAAHALVERKEFSWAQLFSDLEAALPTGVRVGSIAVRSVSRFGELTRAELDMTVVGRQPSDVTGMINEMNRGGTFSAVPVTENHRAGRGESGSEWTLRVNYVQRSRRGSGGEGEAGPRAEAGAGAGAARANRSEGGRERS
jgi:Tfp pilus assembly protein PilN